MNIVSLLTSRSTYLNFILKQTLIIEKNISSKIAIEIWQIILAYFPNWLDLKIYQKVRKSINLYKYYTTASLNISPPENEA